jgi:hypothetical protein
MVFVFLGWLAAWATASAAAEAPGLSFTASSVHSPEYQPGYALDGDPATRWASQAGTQRPEWWQVDFGRSVSVDQVTLTWEAAYAREYELRGSDDGAHWQTVHHQANGKGGKESLTGLHARGRFFRVVGLKPGPYGLYSIWEVAFPEPHIIALLEEARRAAARQQHEQAAATLRTFQARGVREIIFAARPVLGEHWYANFGYYAAYVERPYFGTHQAYREGAKLYRLNLADGKLTALLADPRGGIRDPQVHYDAHKILFSYRPGGTEHYHLYEIHCDGAGLRQLTDGPYDDFEPSYLPDGGIVFVSSRCKRWVNCWTTQVAVLHRCEADGSNVRPISSNNEHDNTPWPLPDGRILYTRWEYVDRSQVDYHHLWTANPDGTGQTVFFGNQRPSTVMIDAKPIPGSDKIVASFSPGHGQEEHRGYVAVVDPQAGPDAAAFARVLTAKPDFRDPWALSEDCFLAAAGAAVVLIDGGGRADEICTLPAADLKAGLQAHEPRPLCARPRERVLSPRSDLAQATGRFLLANVYEGRNMRGVKPGEVKKLLVLESLPKPINFTGGMEPLSYGGTFTLERVLGTVPVEADGSAYFSAPALRSLIFVALDERDLSVKRMQSFATVMPGETVGCTGCHEPRTKPPTAEAPSHLLALARGPSRLEPMSDVPDVLDFPRDIQPILDRHCLKCHDCGQREGGVALSGDRGPHYSLSYYTLTARTQVADGRNRAKSNYPPRALGSSASALLNKLEPAHHEVRVSPLERKTVRLWIETGAPYPGTYAALGCGMIGGYAQNSLDRSAAEWPGTKAAAEALQRRCGACHAGPRALPLSVCDEIVAPPWEDMSPNDPRRRFSRHLLYNLTRPEKSALLLAPLAKPAGGLALCKTGANAPAEVFRDTRDPDYRLVQAAIAEAKKSLDNMKRFDMPGFRPRPEWVREMKRFGILPGAMAANDPIDVYATERRYWASLWHQPGK